MRDPAGQVLALHHPPFRAEVVTVGAALRTLTRDGVDLVAGWPAGEACPAYRGWVLAPWPNRVADGRYAFDGVEHQLPIDEVARGNALHGLAGWVVWTVAAHSDSRAVLTCTLPARPGYPTSLDLTVTYDLGDGGLRVTIEATNVGAARAPYGTGHHPYLTVGRRLDECELMLPAASYAPMDERGHPGAVEPVDGTELDFRTPRLIGATQVDHPFTALDPSGDEVTVVLRDPASGREVRLVSDPATFPWLHAFTADDHGAQARESLAVEPMTCPPDAFGSGTDLVVLEPGDTHRGSFRITGS
jgi:aldose 1-epimerase